MLKVTFPANFLLFSPIHVQGGELVFTINILAFIFKRKNPVPSMRYPCNVSQILKIVILLNKSFQKRYKLGRKIAAIL